MIVKAHRDAKTVVMCQLMGGMAVGRITECNRYVPLSQAPISAQMVMSALLVEGEDKKERQVGFGGKKLPLGVPIETTD